MPLEIQTKLAKFIASLDREKLSADAANQCDIDQDSLTQMIDTYLNEAFIGLDIIAPYLSVSSLILEVGSGIGVLTTFLKIEGYDVIGIEPAEKGGFGFMTALHAALLKQINSDIPIKILPIGAEELTPEIHGHFDLIFSVNVMEHVIPLDEAIAAMGAVITRTGIMRHLCANYSFPYEPHFGLPLVPVFPHMTKYVFPKRINRQISIWHTLNFITASRVRRISARNGLVCKFEQSIMSRFFARLQSDAEFRSRHKGIISKLGQNSLIAKFVIKVLGLVPARFATPMIFTISHRGNYF